MKALLSSEATGISSQHQALMRAPKMHLCYEQLWQIPVWGDGAAERQLKAYELLAPKQQAGSAHNLVLFQKFLQYVWLPNG